MRGEDLETTGQLWGTVLAVQANFYRVQLDLEDKGDKEDTGNPSPHPPLPIPLFPLPIPLLLCTRRTRLKKSGNRLW